MNEEMIDGELNEETETVAEDEELFNETPEATESDEIEFDYDDDGNIVIPDDSADSHSDVDEEDGNNDANDQQAEQPVQEVEEETEKPADAPDSRDAEIDKLRKQLAERDAQIKDTLKCLGADENGGIAELEKIAAEATDTPLEEYRQKKAERMKQEEAIRLVKKQQFEDKIRADLAAVQLAYPETKKYKSVYEFPNFDKFCEYRDMGLTPEVAYIASNPKSVMSSVAGAAQQQARNLNATKSHLRSNVPVGSKDTSITISKRQMAEYKDLFPGMSDKEIVALYKQTIKK